MTRALPPAGLADPHRIPKIAARFQGKLRVKARAKAKAKAKAALIVTRGGAWLLGRRLPCTIGRADITRDKREGDGATPAGVHRITGLLFRADRIARGSLPGWARPIGPRDLWCDDPTHADYNKPVRAPFAASHERLRRADRLYDLILLTDWNRAPTGTARGSAIFLHAWRGPFHPTAGCVAFRPDHLLWIARIARPGTCLVVQA